VCGLSTIIRDFVRRHGLHVVSDGDLDGIFASGLLLRVLGFEGDLEGVVEFPHPLSLSGLRVSSSILIELPLSKGLVYCGENILIDHHPEPPRVELYRDENCVESVVVGGAESVASVVYMIFRDVLELSDTALKILRAIDNIDQGRHPDKLSVDLHNAFSLNKRDDGMRYMLVRAILEDRWGSIIRWAEAESRRFEEQVPIKIEELIGRAQRLTGNVVYFTYDFDDNVEAAAMTNAMISLEDKYDIVIAIATKNNKPISARIATKKDIDLLPVFEKLREQGINAGGRKNVGGAQFGDIATLDETIRILEKAIKNTLTDKNNG